MRKLLRTGGVLIVLGSLICTSTIAESAWTCTSMAGCPGTIQIPMVLSPPGRGSTKEQASAEALRLCNQAQGLCCHITSCTGNDLCGACSQKLGTGLRNAVKSSALVRTHVIQALAAWETCSRTNKCDADPLAKQVKSACMGFADDPGMASCVNHALANP
jgi:hypothetical protein